MEQPLERAWREWERFCTETEGRIKESAASGLPPHAHENTALRTALAALSAPQLRTFLEDSRLEETHREPAPGMAPSTRLAMLLCFLPPHAAQPLAQCYDDPCHAKTNLPPRPRLALFFTLRWKAFLQDTLRREGAVLSLAAHRFHIAYFVGRFGDEAATALLKPEDSPALAQELAKAKKWLSQPSQKEKS